MIKDSRVNSMDFFESPLFLANKKILFYLGQWPLQTLKERFFFRFTTICLVGSIIVPKLIKFYEYFGDFHGMTQCLPVLGLHFVSVIKFCNCCINAPKYKQLTCQIRDDWGALTSDKDNSILRRYATRGKHLCIGYGVYLFATLWMYLLLPVIPMFLDLIAPLNESRQLINLYETQYYIDSDKYYVPLLIHAYITMPFSVAVIIAFDTMIVVYVHHICGIYTILGTHLAAVTSNDVDSESLKARDEAYTKITKCIEMHKSIIQFSDLLESTHTVCFVFVMGMCMIMITLTGFMTVTNLNEPGEALRHAAFAMGEIIHMYYLCWQGQMLSDHSEHIFLAAYKANWCGLSVRAQKQLLLIMMRSSVPCKLTAGKVFILNMESFTAALKTSMSYFTVLLSMR